MGRVAEKVALVAGAGGGIGGAGAEALAVRKLEWRTFSRAVDAVLA